ncbi:hypothetical protein Rhopal_005131-T1 [Rhodotorula paludigena]|uniref:VOC domain-containing protein n=1 Tax=Rhodotorula paludigena TaxID=86838 RepID=A0AAV5GRJ8_9BASI|nr:hypothetical protein Rhopal_005131-T1 [Rhodotorula paludigena]
MATQLPKITHVLELCLYARHLPTSVNFYSSTLRLGKPYLDTPRMAGFSLGETTLLLFQRGATMDDSPMPDNRGLIPGHGLPGGSEADKIKLKTHFALAVEKAEDLEAWEREFAEKSVRVLGKVEWPKGGKSLYFEDPDGHVGELASRGIWPHY